jgi:hypothetical protein
MTARRPALLGMTVGIETFEAVHLVEVVATAMNRVHRRPISTNATGDCSLLMLVRTLAKEGETIVTSHLRSVPDIATERQSSTKETGASSEIPPASHTSHRETTSLTREVLHPIQVPTMAA